MNDVEQNIINDFSQLKPLLIEWGIFVDAEIVRILKPLDDEHRIKIYPSFRLKLDSSYLSKALYRRKPYENPLLEIEDKIGTRVIFLKSTDLEEASFILTNNMNWVAKTSKNIKSVIEEKPNEFDYQSIHIIVKPKEEFGMLKTEHFDMLTCEIQLRTLLQHAFAEVSHDSTYKGPYKNDREIIRSLAKSMALMEATDDYFCEVFEMIKDDKRKFKNYINELIKLYSGFNSNFDSKKLDIEVTDLIFSMLLIKDVPIEAIDIYCQQKSSQLIEILKGKNYLIQQPIFLLVAYLIENHPNFIKSYWPMSEDSLKYCFYVLGISFDNY